MTPRLGNYVTQSAFASANRRGDQLVITRLGRSVLHLFTLSATRGTRRRPADARARHRHDPPKAEPRSECWRSWQNSNENSPSPTPAMGWQAARARVRKCGRRPKPTPEQAVHSEERYGAGNCTVQQIADLKTTRLIMRISKSRVPHLGSYRPVSGLATQQPSVPVVRRRLRTTIAAQAAAAARNSAIETVAMAASGCTIDSPERA